MASSTPTPWGSAGAFVKILFVGLFGLLLWMPLVDLSFSFLPKLENTEKRHFPSTETSMEHPLRFSKKL